MDSLAQSDRNLWRYIRKELESVSLTVTAFEASKSFILDWLHRAKEQGAFEEVVTNCPQSRLFQR